jgi:DNA-binding LacI/PurR family transcriptional regulator
VRVVGFDDAKHARALAVPLTTVHQPCADIARVAYRAMRERIIVPTLPTRSLLLATLGVLGAC